MYFIHVQGRSEQEDWAALAMPPRHQSKGAERGEHGGTDSEKSFF